MYASSFDPPSICINTGTYHMASKYESTLVGRKIDILLRYHPCINKQADLAKKIGVTEASISKYKSQYPLEKDLPPSTRNNLEDSFGLPRGSFDLKEDKLTSFVQGFFSGSLGAYFEESKLLEIYPLQATIASHRSYGLKTADKVKELQILQHTQVRLTVDIPGISRTKNIQIEDLLVFIEEEDINKNKEVWTLRPSCISMCPVQAKALLKLPDEGREIFADGVGHQTLMVIGIPSSLTSSPDYLNLIEKIEGDNNEDLTPNTLKKIKDFIMQNRSKTVRLKKCYVVR